MVITYNLWLLISNIEISLVVAIIIGTENECLKVIKMNYMGSIFSNFGAIIKYGCLAHCTVQFVGDFVVCSGPSMEPTLHSDDILFTEHITPLKGQISKGDIIIAKCPTNPKQQICKRVVGLPGESVKVGFATYKHVPRGHVWLEGDNRSNSLDSRSYGPIPQGLIRSRAICKVWPLKDFTVLIS